MAIDLRHLLRRHRGIVLFIVLMVVFRSAIADWNDVPSTSMSPTILAGDRIWVNKLAYDMKLPLTGHSLLRLGEPQRGEVVVFDSAAADLRLVKRVVAVPGDVVSLRGNRLSINGQQAHYERIGQDADGEIALERIADHQRQVTRAPRRPVQADFGPVIVPPDQFLAMGDNRDNSIDSRVYGFVPRHELLGRTGTVVFSLDYQRWLRPRGERFLKAMDGDLDELAGTAAAGAAGKG